MNKTYLGYGIYVERLGEDIAILREDADDGGDDLIILSPEVFEALVDWVDSQKESA